MPKPLPLCQRTRPQMLACVECSRSINNAYLSPPSIASHAYNTPYFTHMSLSVLFKLYRPNHGHSSPSSRHSAPIPPLPLLIVYGVQAQNAQTHAHTCSYCVAVSILAEDHRMAVVKSYFLVECREDCILQILPYESGWDKQQDKVSC